MGGDDAFIEAYGRSALAQAVGVDADALGRGQVVDAPPAHLQEDEGDEEPPECCTAVAVCSQADVYVGQVGKPRRSCPRLLRIPRPVMSPGFLGPQRTEENTYGHKRPADLHEVVANIHLVLVDRRLLEPKQVGRHKCGCPQHCIGEHIDNDVGRKPWTLQCRHQCLIVDLRVDQIDRGENSCQDGAESKDPRIAPA